MDESEEKIDKALDIVLNNIVNLTKEYSVEKDKEKSKELQKKIKLLNDIQDTICKGNIDIAYKVLEKNSKGML